MASRVPSGAVSADPVFAHGVASADPTPDAVVLWTRVSGATGHVRVGWRVATRPELDQVVSSGEAVAGADADHTVKVDVQGLDPSTTYFYAFEANGHRSPVGRTRTAPRGHTDNLRLAVVSCASWAHGFFNAYRHVAERDVDLVVHVGDYLYENAGAGRRSVRAHVPAHRLRTLGDYRARHAQYRSDPDLQRLHQQHPVVAVWDDHEIAGNTWRDGAADHDPTRDGDWERRRAAAVRAYLEWVPLRLPDPVDRHRIWRSFAFGDLAQLAMLDTRLAGRDRPLARGERAVLTVGDRRRSLLGSAQREWLREELRSSTARWHLVGNQVMMAPLRVLEVPPPLRRLLGGLVAGGVGVNAGQWDGYPEERASLFGFLAEEGIGNVVVLTGDVHSSWAGELTLQPDDGGGVVGVEFVTPSVTAPSFVRTVAPPLPGVRAVLPRIVARQNPHLRFFDLEGHGYVEVDVDAERVRAEWWHVDGVARRRPGERLVAGWEVRDGAARLHPVQGPLPARRHVPPPAPPER